MALATEIATFLALQASPVHPSVLAASVWPRGVTPEVRDAALERVREWLGTDAEGNHHLRSDDDGRLSLVADVAVDWHAFGELALRARKVGPRDERELLRRALHLVRGPFLDGRPDGRYAWLARTRLEAQVEDVVVDAAHRLGRAVPPRPRPGRCGRGGPRRSAAGPRLAAAVAGPAPRRVRRSRWRRRRREAAATMAEVLADRGAAIEAETDALVEELLPARGVPGRATPA